MSLGRLVGNTLVWLAAFPAVASVVMFSRVRWWRSQWGRHVMVYMSSVALVLLLAALRQVIGDSLVFYWLRTAAFGLVTVALWWRLVIVVSAYREGEPD